MSKSTKVQFVVCFQVQRSAVNLAAARYDHQNRLVNARSRFVSSKTEYHTVTENLPQDWLNEEITEHDFMDLIASAQERYMETGPDEVHGSRYGRGSQRPRDAVNVMSADLSNRGFRSVFSFGREIQVFVPSDRWDPQNRMVR